MNKESKTISANKILSVSLKEPEQLFSFSKIEEIKHYYRKLVKIWHPDINKNENAPNVFKHISALYSIAIEKFNSGVWQSPERFKINSITITNKENETYKIQYFKKHEFELGEFYISDSKLIYIIKNEFKDLFEHAIKIINNLHYHNDSMQKVFKPLFPNISKYLQKNGNQKCIRSRFK